METYPRPRREDVKSKIKKGIKIKLDCEFCKGPINGHPHIFKFANYERFSRRVQDVKASERCIQLNRDCATVCWTSFPINVKRQ